MTQADWWEPLLRGLFGLGAAGVAFLAARWRLVRTGSEQGAADNGLD